MTRQASGTAGLNDLEGNAIGMQADRTGWWNRIGKHVFNY
jgi:hypothetical protein